MDNQFLPISKDDLRKRNWEQLDIILVTGDAYVDHPSYGVTVIGRVLEANGFKVGVIAQPDWKKKDDFVKLGRPRLFFGVTSGNIDSMIANYTANKRLRSEDSYSPGNQAGLRPNRAVIVYSQKLREIYKDAVIVLGGVEASLRRLGHYDYWDNDLRRSILLDSRANILTYGMGERPVVEIAKKLNQGVDVENLNGIRGTVVVRKDLSVLEDYLHIPSFEKIKSSKQDYNQAFRMLYQQMNPFTGKTILQQYDNRWVVQFPPSMPLSSQELDEIYALPYQRNWHPVYDKKTVSALEPVRFSITAHRGCFGECSFCALSLHQGRIVQSRSPESIIKEVELISQEDNFTGVISDVGGPTANMYQSHCLKWKRQGFCADKKCLLPNRCQNLKLGYKASIELYRKLRLIKKVKHVFIGSGLRYDLLVNPEDKDYLEEICRYHISGLLKVAPEHCDNKVLALMNKPSFNVYEKFVDVFKKTVLRIGKKIFLVNYFICAHPGSSLKEALKLGLYLAKRKIRPEQIQDFIPTPMTVSSCMYYTGKHPFTNEDVYVAYNFRERKMQRALIQYNKPTNRKWIIQALKELKALNLLRKFIGK